jgi:hypothetical protein
MNVSLYVYDIRGTMGNRSLFTLKGFRAGAVAAELHAISAVKKWRKHFVGGRTSLPDDLRPGRQPPNDLAEAISSI